MVTFAVVRFLGDILAKTMKFHVFTLFYHKFTKICQNQWGNLTTRETVKTTGKQWWSRKPLKTPLFDENGHFGKNGKFG